MYTVNNPSNNTCLYMNGIMVAWLIGWEYGGWNQVVQNMGGICKYILQLPSSATRGSHSLRCVSECVQGYIDGSMQKWRNSIANALESRLVYTKPSIWYAKCSIQTTHVCEQIGSDNTGWYIRVCKWIMFEWHMEGICNLFTTVFWCSHAMYQHYTYVCLCVYKSSLGGAVLCTQ